MAYHKYFSIRWGSGQNFTWRPRGRPARRRGVSLLILAVVCGCAHVPVRETAQYADAFHDVAAVTNDLLSDYAAATDSVAARASAASNRPAVYPIQFDPAAALSADTPDPAVLGFQRALGAIEEYNAALLDLAQGGGDERFAAHAQRASKLIEALGIGTSPAGVPATELVRELLSLLAQAHTRKQFTDALERGRPVLDKLLQGFIDATPDFYRVRVGIVGAAITEIEFKQETVLDELDRIAQDYAPPAAGSNLALCRAQIESEVAALRLAVSPDAVVRPLPTGPRPFDSAAQDRLEEQVRVLRGLCTDRKALAAGLASYHQHLSEYVRLLNEARGYFDALLRAAGKGGGADLAVHTHDIQAQSSKLDRAVRESRSALALPATPKP